MRLIRWLLRKPPYWMPTLKGPLRPLWPVYRVWSNWRERHDTRQWIAEMEVSRLRAWLRLVEATTDHESGYYALHGYDAPDADYIERVRVWPEHTHPSHIEKGVLVACIGCPYGTGGLMKPCEAPRDDRGRAFLYIEGEWRCADCAEERYNWSPEEIGGGQR
jgi:hypothetical protein